MSSQREPAIVAIVDDNMDSCRSAKDELANLRSAWQVELLQVDGRTDQQLEQSKGEILQRLASLAAKGRLTVLLDMALRRPPGRPSENVSGNRVWSGNIDGLDWIPDVRTAVGPDAPVFMWSAWGTVLGNDDGARLAAEAGRRGADDVFWKKTGGMEAVVAEIEKYLERRPIREILSLEDRVIVLERLTRIIHLPPNKGASDRA